MKKFLLSIMTLALAACSQFDFDKYNGEYSNKEYDSNFKEMVGGEIHPHQDWGFYTNLTRTAQPNSNQWGTHDDNDKYLDYPRPNDITSEELAAVLAVFNEKGKEKYEPLVNLQNFFVQQVWCGENGSKMNELATTVDYRMEVVSWWPYEEKRVDCDPYDDIVNNFNGGCYSGNPLQGCMLMWNSSTLDFSYKTSQSMGRRLYGHWRMEYIAPYGYFVGFDHEAYPDAGNEINSNEWDQRDYIYNDWIIKIVPGLGYEFPSETTSDTLYAVRIMGEDLGTTDDFDFNDIVFDAVITEDYIAHITLQAAGGTIPLYIGGHEVHKEFGVPIYTMVNTGSGPNLSPVSFDLEGFYQHPKDIEIRVDHGNFVYTLKAEIGEVPQKFACPIGTPWMKERHNINTGYPKFGDWARTKEPKRWYNEVTETSQQNLYQ